MGAAMGDPFPPSNTGAGVRVPPGPISDYQTTPWQAVQDGSPAAPPSRVGPWHWAQFSIGSERPGAWATPSRTTVCPSGPGWGRMFDSHAPRSSAPKTGSHRHGRVRATAQASGMSVPAKSKKTGAWAGSWSRDSWMNQVALSSAL